MLRKTLVVVIMVAFAGSSPGAAQSADSVRFDETEAATVLGTLGDNGQIINRLERSVTSTDGNCVTTAVGTTLVESYCADDNGCTVRLVTRYSQFVPHPPAGFALDPDTGIWRVSRLDVVDGFSYFSGIHSNDVVANIMATTINVDAGSFDICSFFDDYVPSGPLTGLFFGLRACWAGFDFGNTTCTLTIED
jgi:hypothetical protein